MLCVVIQGPTIEEAHKQLTQARTRADMAELRLDLFSSRDLSSLLSLRAACPMPTILTLRHQSHGGMYHGSWDEWAFEVQGLLPLHPEYIDVETDCPLTIVSMLSRSTKIILSYHNFDATPDDLDGLLSTMMKTPASLYKISVMARTASATSGPKASSAAMSLPYAATRIGRQSSGTAFSFRASYTPARTRENLRKCTEQLMHGS